MSKTTDSKEQPERVETRLPYVPPSVISEETFEPLALSCVNDTICEFTKS